jgi:hypothetical protein
MASVCVLGAERAEQPAAEEAPRPLAWFNSDAVRAASVPFALTRLSLLALTTFLSITRRTSPLTLLDRWDTRWYVGIGSHGYHWSIGGKPALAFFPMLPAILHTASAAGLPAILVGFLLANASFAGALVYLYLLIEPLFGAGAARRSLWLFALFPTAVFSFVPYTEGPFLLCATGALYHAGRRQPLHAGLWVAAAVLLRSTGAILVIPVIMLLWPLNLRSIALAAAPTIAAFSAYVSFLWSNHLQAATVLLAQRSWHRGISGPWQGFASSIGWLQRHGADPATSMGENLLGFGVATVCLALTVIAWRHLSPAMAAYCAGFWLLVLCSTAWHEGYYAPFVSMDRFVFVLFPLAGWAGWWMRGWVYRGFLAISGTVMMSAAIVHLTGGWVG